MIQHRIEKTTFALLMLVFACSTVSAEEEHKAGFSMGNGEKNSIDVKGVTRDESVLTFPEVQIDGNGWLVIHPFEKGMPNGDKVVAVTYLKDGMNKDVKIDVLKGLKKDEKFIVMLHRDVNENKALDFIFVDAINVLDKAVFEGSRMIGHIVAAP